MQGTYLPETSADESASFVIPPGVQVFGGFAGDEMVREQRSPSLYNMTVLDGNLTGTVGSPQNSNHIVRIPPGGSGGDTTVLDGFLITNGYADDASGPAASGSGAGLLIGNGVAAVGSTVRLKNLRFTGCRSAVSGGAVAGFNLDRLQMSDCLFTGCEAGHTVGSTSIGSGGAIHLEDSGFGSDDIAIHAVRIASNRAPRGAAISFSRMTAGRYSLVNSLIQGNVNSEPSAAVYVDVDDPLSGGSARRFIISHCTISGNFGGGVEIADSDGVSNLVNSVRIQSSIIWGNRRIFSGGVASTEPNLFGDALDNPSVAVTYSDIGTSLAVAGASSVYPGTMNINANPKFLSSGTGGYQLAADSPCIDAADDARLCPGPSSVLGLGDVADRDGNTVTDEPIEVDLAGETREEGAVPSIPANLRGNDVSFGGRISDMGCFERQFDGTPGGVD